MPLPKLTAKKIIAHKLTRPLLIVGLFLLLAAAASWYGLNHYQDRFYPNTAIGNISISNLTRQQANELLSARWDILAEHGWSFQADSKSALVYPTANLAEGAPPLFMLDQETTINRAWENNRGHYWWQQLALIVFTWFKGNETPAAIIINEDLLTKELQNNFQSLVVPAQPAKISVKTDGSYQITPETAGQAIGYPAGIQQLGRQLAQLEQNPINLQITSEQPLIRQAAVGNLDSAIKTYLDLAPLNLTASSSHWTVNKAAVADWLALEIRPDGSVSAGPASSSIAAYLTEHIAKEIDQEPQAGQFQRVGNRLQQFRPGRDGRKLDIGTSTQTIIQALQAGTSTTELTIQDIKSPLTDSDPSSLGITELLGTGTSNFAGSPANRIHNIKVGTNQVSGQLIAPDEEFSLVKTLGDISGASGYKQELVIKDNKTIPEYGGGLCQVGTTVFRAALAAGLPITQRQNHSYRVVYYEPAGTDAAIYDPWPDVRFINDTGHYMLFLGEVSGNQLSFSLWGTKDGRIAKQTKPVVYNIVKPAAKQIIETDSLAPGKIKCTEKAHNGADAYFDYAVTYASGETKNKRFSSHYVPWREVCLIGKGATSTAATTTTPISSTTVPAISTSTITTTTVPATSTNNLIRRLPKQKDEL